MFITHAAIMFSNGEVVEGKSYHTISMLAQRIGYSGDKIYGFLDSSGEFQLPHDAAVTAMESGQITQAISELSPGDLWPALYTD